jgi:Papain-like cysteine protease AvrRpt2
MRGAAISFLTPIIATIACVTSFALASVGFDYTVPGQFFLVKQPTDMVCWAVAATMLRSWKVQQKLDPAKVMDDAGVQFRVKFDHNQGLGADEKVQFLSAMHLQSEPPATYTASGILSLLQLHGPLWVTTTPSGNHSFAIHARIIIGITGSDQDAFVTIADPADGTKHVESFKDFTAEMEAIAKQDYGAGADVRPLIVHF